MQSKSIYLYLVLGLIVSLFSACGSTPAPKKVQTPEWVKLPPKDTAKSIYGLGISKTRDEALSAALNDVISKLGVKVESSFTNKQIVNGYYSKSISTSDIKADVAKIRVTNYQVEKSHRISFREYAVLVKVDNNKFFNTLKQDIEQTKKNIETKIESSSYADAITRYNSKKAISKECEVLISNSLVAYELNNSFDKNKYFNFVSSVKDNFHSEVNSLSFYVSGSKYSKSFVDVIKKQLLKNDYNVKNKYTPDSIHIKLSTNDNIETKKNIVTIKLNIKVIDAKRIIGSNSFVLKERFKSSKLNIYNSASIHFEQDVNKEGIEDILNIGIDK